MIVDKYLIFFFGSEILMLLIMFTNPQFTNKASVLWNGSTTHLAPTLFNHSIHTARAVEQLWNGCEPPMAVVALLLQVYFCHQRCRKVSISAEQVVPYRKTEMKNEQSIR